MEKKKVVLAFSGGLDTSFCAMYLSQELGYEVYTALANTGGFDAEELKRVEARAYKLGAAKHVSLDITQEYYEKSIKYMIFGNVLRMARIPFLLVPSAFFRHWRLSIMRKKLVPTLWLTAVRGRDTTRCVSTSHSMSWHPKSALSRPRAT
jgi:argininosuccinate synthase